MKGVAGLVVAGLVACAASPLAGQADSAVHAHIAACMRAHPDLASPPTVVYAYALVDAMQEQVPAVRIAAENLLQPIADGLARLLGGKPGVLPVADSTIPWYGVKADVYVEVGRNGRVTYQPDSTAARTVTERLIERAIDSAVAHQDGPLVIAPDGALPPDQSRFRIITTHAPTAFDGDWHPTKIEGVAVPVFATRFPSNTEVDAPKNFVPPHFPWDARLSQVEGTVIEDFVVDIKGRADMSTLRDEWPAGVPKLTGQKRLYWEGFVTSVHTWLAHAHFKPATIAGCPVPQLVRQPFEFDYSRESE